MRKRLFILSLVAVAFCAMPQAVFKSGSLQSYSFVAAQPPVVKDVTIEGDNLIIEGATLQVGL